MTKVLENPPGSILGAAVECFPVQMENQSSQFTVLIAENLPIIDMPLQTFEDIFKIMFRNQGHTVVKCLIEKDKARFWFSKENGMCQKWQWY